MHNLKVCFHEYITFYFNRSAARLKQGQFAAALQDAIRARELCPSWPKAYYRQGNFFTVCFYPNLSFI